MARLLLMHDDVVISEFELGTNPFTIGRALHCNLTIDDPLVSQHHAQIERHEDAQQGRIHYLLKDLNSTNGSFVNGEQVGERTLRDRDVLRFGTKHFVFRDEQANEQQKTRKLKKSWIPGVFYTTCGRRAAKSSASATFSASTISSSSRK